MDIATVQSPAVRITLFLVCYLVILLGASVPKGMAPPRFADLVWGIVASLLILAMTHVMLRREQRVPGDVGLAANSGTIVRLCAGMLIGFGVYALTMIAISQLIAPVSFSSAAIPSTSTQGLVFVSFLALSAMEELGFRGYALRTLVRDIGVWKAQSIIALAFGLSHVAFGWPLSAILLGVIPSGLLFGALAIRSGGLAMPIGTHAALNIAQWAVGEKDTPGIWTLSIDPSHTERMAAASPVVGLVITLALAVAITFSASRQPEASR